MARRFLPFAALLALGCAGILSLWPSLAAPAADLIEQGVAPTHSDSMLRLLLLVQPTLMVALAVAIGLFASPKVGLRSIIADRAAGREPAHGFADKVFVGLIGGGAAGLLIVAGDLFFSPWTASYLAPIRVPEEEQVQALLVGVLYGGLTEEILIRWGLLSLLAWLLSRMGLPLRWALVTAIVVSSVLFGVSHLPALAAATELGTALVIRTIVLNAMAGCIFGALFVRHNLETAMLAHAVAHLVIFAGRLAGVAY